MTERKDVVEMRVEGMDCNNCALSIQRFLEREGYEDVLVNFQTKEVRYRPTQELGGAAGGAVKQGIEKLGFQVVDVNGGKALNGEATVQDTSGGVFSFSPRQRLLICAALTVPLLLGHLIMVFGTHVPLLQNGWVQLGLSLPVYLIGGLHFGRSALGGLRTGYLNMDVLIFLGATAAFVYSLVGLAWQNPEYYFFETAATIITLVLVGNWLEARAVARTTTSIHALNDLREETVRILQPSGNTTELPIERVEAGTRAPANMGDKIALDGKILSGYLAVNEAMLTGESLPVEKGVGDTVIGGSIVVAGNAVYEVTAIYRDGTLARIIELVKTAQADKPQLQRLADRISAIFVPVVIGLSILTFLIGWGTGYATATQALMNAIAVLLISCPCAMGLATPTAVMVGVGRLARAGVLIRGGSTVEELARTERIVFDKTGTLTTGELEVERFAVAEGYDPGVINRLVFELEAFSSHPIASSLRNYLWKQPMVPPDDSAYLEFAGRWEVTETPGLGLRGGDFYLGADPALGADVVLRRGEEILASAWLVDELRPQAAATIAALKADGLSTTLLTGDRPAKAQRVADALGIQEVHAGQNPDQKLELITALSQERPTAMVGDGINDAAALSRADVGISLGGASAAALDAARVVLMRDDLSLLIEGKQIAKLTLRTIRESLFWAFSYNIIAIPIAALGYLNPMWAALFMAFSDVVVIGNAIRLRTRT